jgi:4-amino-4-deoxy-L-arabinose transferase-like glycosyltransferase
MNFKHLHFHFSTINFPLLGLVLLIAIVLRFSFFGVVPPSLNWDEASLGYNAFSILKTGKDEWGRFMPLTFEAFGDYKLPVYIYLAVPFVGILGLNEWSVRLPSMLAGVFSVFLLYWIVLVESRNQKWALISALLLAVSPWGTFLSRVALEANLALCIFLVGIFFLILGYKLRQLAKKESVICFVVSAVFFGLTLFTYNSARVFIPLFLLSVGVVRFSAVKEIGKKLWIPAIVFALFIGVAGFLALTQDSASRYYWVSILDEGAINFLNQSRGESQLPGILTKLIYNRYSYFGYEFFKNYISHFSPYFLFVRGGDNYQFSVQNMGLMYALEAPFLIYGIWRIRKYPSAAKLIIPWMILAPIPAAITRESPHVLRSIFMLGSLQILVGLGIADFIEWLKKVWKISYFVSFSVIGILVGINIWFYFSAYLTQYPKEYSQSWQYGYKEAIQFVESKPNVKERPLYFTKKYGEPHIFYLFYTQYDPAKYQANPSLIRYQQSNWRWVDQLDNVYFINDWEMKDKLKDQHGYVISTPGNYPGIPPVLQKVNFLDGKGAFEVVEI